MPHTLIQILAIGSAVVNLLGTGIYLLLIKRGKVKPERAAWWIWTLLMVVALAVQIAQGASWSLLLTASYLVGNLAISILSLRYGYGKFKAYDLAALLLVFVGLYLWHITSNELTALAIIIILDLLGAVLLAHKTWRAPYTESTVSAYLFAIGALLGLLSVGGINEKAIFPAYVTIINTSILILILGRRAWRSKKIKSGIQKRKRKNRK